jgi:hypothetical protein
MNCIVYLVRSSEDDLIDFNKSLSLLEKNLIPFTDNVDLVVFCEKSFEKFKSRVETQLDIKYQLIEFNLPDYPKEILDNIPEFFPHPTHGNGPVAWGHPGFSMGYRHMCRFFSGEMYKFDVIKNYDYYLRLDTDSFIHTPLNYDIFEWAKENECYYGFIAPAVQQDNEKVVEGLWDFVNQVYPNNIPDRLMFYTNFELGKVSWFLTSEYMNFYNYIDKSGGIYSRRWGDAPIKFLGINLFMNKQNIIPVQGFTYQHGAVYTV